MYELVAAASNEKIYRFGGHRVVLKKVIMSVNPSHVLGYCRWAAYYCSAAIALSLLDCLLLMWLSVGGEESYHPVVSPQSRHSIVLYNLR